MSYTAQRLKQKWSNEQTCSLDMSFKFYNQTDSPLFNIKD